MNNNKSSGLGCGLLIIVAVLVSVFQFLFTTPAGIVLLVLGVGAAIFAYVASKRKRQQMLIDSLDGKAQTLDNIVAGKVSELQTGFNLAKGEKFIFALENVSLTEYQSTGSSYSGTSVGASVPLFGSVRGNVSAQGGQITKNPEELTTVDQGRAIFTDQRIVFSGAKFVRDWDLAKTIELSPALGGFSVRIAVSNRERTSGLQSVSAYDIGPGVVAEYVFKLHSEGATKAKAWAKDISERFRAGASNLRSKLPSQEIEAK